MPFKGDMKHTDIISRKEAIKTAEGCHFSNVPKELAKLPSISESEAVKAIWSAQIDDLIAKIKVASLGKHYVGRIDGKTDEVVLMEDVIEILEGAK